MCLYIHLYMYVCNNVCIHIHIYIYIYTHCVICPLAGSLSVSRRPRFHLATLARGTPATTSVARSSGVPYMFCKKATPNIRITIIITIVIAINNNIILDDILSNHNLIVDN